MKLLIAFVMCTALAACKQGPGERCQVDSDCEEGNCSQAEPKVCGGTSAGQLDAGPLPRDAGPPVPIDAPDAAL